VIHHRVLFEIAAYRCDREQWARECASRMASLITHWKRIAGPIPDEQLPSLMESARYSTARNDWIYNEVIGWIRLTQDGTSLKAYLFPVTSPTRPGGVRRSYQRGFRPFPFANGHLTHKLFEYHPYATDSNADIFVTLRAELAELLEPGGDLARRCLDTEAFEAAGPLIDWHAALFNVT